MPSCVAMTCGCGHAWCEYGNAIDLPALLSVARCPACQEIGHKVGRAAEMIADPTRALTWTPARDRPCKIKRWACMRDPETPQADVMVSLLTSVTWPSGDWEEIGYDIEVSVDGHIGTVSRFDANGSAGLWAIETPPHLLDIARSIALDLKPVPNWEAFVQQAIARTRDGEAAGV